MVDGDIIQYSTKVGKMYGRHSAQFLTKNLRLNTATNN